MTRFVNKSEKSSIFRNLRSLVTINQGVLSLSAFFVEIRRLKDLIESGGVVVDRALLIIVAIYGLGPCYQTICDESITTVGAARYNEITLTDLFYECENHDEAADNMAIEAAPLISAGNAAPAEDLGYAVLTREQVDIIVTWHNADNTFCPVSRANHVSGHLALLDMGFVKNIPEAARQKCWSFEPLRTLVLLVARIGNKVCLPVLSSLSRPPLLSLHLLYLSCSLTFLLHRTARLKRSSVLKV